MIARSPRRGSRVPGELEQLLADALRDFPTQPFELETIDMEELVRDVWSRIEDRGHTALVLGKLPAARGHRAMVAAAWSRLLSNAVRYSARSDVPRVEVSGSEVADYAIYGVRDNGTGFNLGYSGKLAHIFPRLAAEAESTGTGLALALAVAQVVVARHGGNLWVDVYAGQGSFFQFSLPRRDGS